MNQADRLYEVIQAIIREEIEHDPCEALPANLEAERSILGTALLDNSKIDSLEKLTEDFSLASHRAIALKILSLHRQSKPVDIIVLANAFTLEKCSEIGGVAYLASLTEGLAAGVLFDEYISIVQEKAKLRRIMGACQEAARKCQEQQELASDIVADLGVALRGIGKRTK